MNNIIEIACGGLPFPVKWLHYHGNGEPYVVYSCVETSSAFYGDDELQSYTLYYDFDIYSKANYNNNIILLKQALENAGFTWNPSRTSRDMYETETGYYHKTLSFSINKEG